MALVIVLLADVICEAAGIPIDVPLLVYFLAGMSFWFEGTNTK